MTMAHRCHRPFRLTTNIIDTTPAESYALMTATNVNGWGPSSQRSIIACWIKIKPTSRLRSRVFRANMVLLYC